MQPDDLPEELRPYLADNERVFAEPLPGHNTALGSPGGAAKLGTIDGDTELVASHPPPAERPDRHPTRKSS